MRIRLLVSRGLSSAAFFAFVPFLLMFLTARFGFSVKGAGITLGVLFVAARVLALPAGRLIDRLGPEAFITWSSLACALAVAGLYVVPSGADVAACALILARNTASSAQTIAYRVAIRRAATSASVRVFSDLGVAMNLGAILGPMLVALSGLTGSLAVTFALHLAACACAPRGTRIATAVVAPAVARVRHAAWAGFVASYLVFWIVLQQISLALSYYCDHALGSAKLASVYFAIQGALVIPGMLVVGRKLALRDHHRMFFASGLVLCAAYVAFGACGTAFPLARVVALAVLMTVVEVLAIPIADALVVALAPADQLGAAFGELALVQALGIGLGSVAGGLALQYFDDRGALAHFWMCAGACGLVALLVVRLDPARRRGLASRLRIRASRAAYSANRASSPSVSRRAWRGSCS